MAIGFFLLILKYHVNTKDSKNKNLYEINWHVPVEYRKNRRPMVKTKKLHKPHFISRYHNFPEISGANNAWNLIWGYFKAVVGKLLWLSTPSRDSWNFIKLFYFTFYVIVIEQRKKDAYASLYFYIF